MLDVQNVLNTGTIITILFNIFAVVFSIFYFVYAIFYLYVVRILKKIVHSRDNFLFSIFSFTQILIGALLIFFAVLLFL